MQTLDGGTSSERALAGLLGWTRRGDRFVKTFIRDDFHSAVLFAGRARRIQRLTGDHHHPIGPAGA